jgi:hypothetical protein
MIAHARLEPRITYLLAGFASAKKGLESEIYALDDVLQNLGIDLGQFWAHVLACRQFCALVSKAKGEASHAIGIAPLLQGCVIDLAAQGEPRVEGGFLLLRRIHSELIGFVHHTDLFLLGQEKAEMAPHPRSERGTLLSPPYLKRGALRGRILVIHVANHGFFFNDELPPFLLSPLP